MSDDGKCTQVLESIIDHATSKDALAKSKKYIICKNGKCLLQKTKIGWFMLVK